MINRKIIFYVFWLVLAIVYNSTAFAAINIVAAENFYGEVTKELGGPYVNVATILNSPNQDPHLFTISPKTAVMISNASIIIYNGADYDPWITSLLASNNQQNKHIIVVANLMNIKKGSNPHIWYMPNTVPTLAKNLIDTLIELDPVHKIYFQQQLKHFNQSYQPIFDIIKNLKQQFNHINVIATEPFFNYMAEAIGLKMLGMDFQNSIMNDVPPTFSQVKQFEEVLRHHIAAVLIFNKQVINPATQRMILIAQQQKIPVVGMNETLPNDTTYIQWIMQELHQLKRALATNKSPSS